MFKFSARIYAQEPHLFFKVIIFKTDYPINILFYNVLKIGQFATTSKRYSLQVELVRRDFPSITLVGK